ncbi:MAG TPA: hypothetical protein VF139_17775 [Candidatus Polarisedimenticolaceae bacterium]
MRNRIVLLGVAALVAFLATSAFAANRGVTFTPIGFIQNPAPSNYSSVWDMNPEGTVFLVSPNASGAYTTLWTREDGWGALVGNGGPGDMSSGGVIMGNGIYPGSNPLYLWPGTWNGVVDQWTPIPPDAGYAPCGSSRMTYYDMGGEGDYAVGLTWQGCSIAQGWLWDKATNTTIALGRPNGKSTRANAVTHDGSTVAGWGTNLQGLRRGATWQGGSWTFLGDPDGREPKICAQSGQGCTFNGSGTNGCPEFVDDGTCASRGTCQNKGTCVSNVCVGGTNPGTSCTSNSQCRGACAGGSNPGTQCTSDSVCAGTCTGPNAGATCTSNGACPDTLVCINNPDWTDDLFKGEVYDMTGDGSYVVGRNFDYGAKFNSGFRRNPDGTFTEIPPPETWPYLVDPYGGVSEDGKVAVGVAGTRLTGTAPIVWIEGVGTIDLQLFLISQGLDELYFWYLAQANTVSADGTVVAGYGFNPDNRMEGFIVDMKKLWVCHSPSGNPESARTLGIELGSAADHVAHGDFLGTCEFLNAGGLSRAADMRRELANKAAANAASSTQIDPTTSEIGAPWSPTPGVRKFVGGRTGERVKNPRRQD